MEKNKPVDYEQVIREYDESRKGPALNTDCLQRFVPAVDGVVDYQTVLKEFQRYLISDESEVIYTGKKQTEVE